MQPALCSANFYTSFGCFRFVEFATVREAETAIQLLHNKDMGRGISLAVKVSDSKKNREERYKKKKEEDAFLNTLNCARKNGDSVEGARKDDEWNQEEEDKMSSNPLQPRHIDTTPHQTSVVAGGEVGPSSAEKLTPGSTGSPGSGKGAALKPCVVCQTQTQSRCKCKTPYCGVACQTQDWPKHKLTCKAAGSPSKVKRKLPFATAASAAVSPPSRDTAPLKIAENSDDEGFVVDCPDGDDLIPIKSMIKHVKDGGSPSDLQVFDTSSHQGTRKPLLPSPSNSLPVSKRNQPPLSPVELPDSSVHKSTMESRPRKLDLYGNNSESKSLPASRQLLRSDSNDGLLQYPLTRDVTRSLPGTPFQNVNRPSGVPSSSSLSLSAGRLGPFAANAKLLPTSRLPLPMKSLQSVTTTKSNDTDVLVPFSLIFSQFDMVPQPLPSLPVTSCLPPKFVAIVTCYHSCNQFTVIAPSVESKLVLQQIAQCSQQFQPGTIIASFLSEGSKCGYMDSNGNFMRVNVMRVFSSSVLVRRYDFGGCLNVQSSELCYLPEDVVVLPSLAQLCRLKHVFLSEHGKANIHDGCKALKGLVNGRLVVVDNHGALGCGPDEQLLLCTLQSKDGRKNFSKELSASPYVTTSRNNDPQSLLSPDTLKLVRLSSSIEFHPVLANTVIEITPTVVANPNIIWAQVVHSHMDKMEAMHEDMNKSYPPPISFGDPYVPTVGEICVAKYVQDQCYYRAEVLCVNHSGMVDIRFVETGYTDTVTTSQLHHIHPTYLTLPKQALKFSMAGIVPAQSTHWSSNAVGFLRERILNRRVTVDVLSVSQAVYMVNMFDPEVLNQLLNNSLIVLGHAEASTEQKQTMSGEPTSRALSGVSVGTKAPLRKAPNLPTLSASSSARSVLEPVNEANETTSSSFEPEKELPSLSVPAVSSVTTSFSQSASGKPAVFDSKETAPSLEEVGDRAVPSPCKDTGREYFDPLILPEQGGFLKVCISTVVNPNVFYCQLIEPGNMEKVSPVLEKIEKLDKASLVPMTAKFSGKPCLCHFSDGCLHRAKIVACKNSELKVAFVDYGNTYSPQDCDVYEIKPEFLDIPIQGILCSLNLAQNPAGKKSDWDSAATKFFQSTLEQSSAVKMRVVKVVGLLHVVDVMLTSTSEGEKNLLDLMQKSGHCVSHNRVKPAQGQEKSGGGHHKDSDSRSSKPSPFQERKFPAKSPRSKSVQPSCGSPFSKSAENANAGQGYKSPHGRDGQSTSPRKSARGGSRNTPPQVGREWIAPKLPQVSEMPKLSFPTTPETFKILVCELVSLQEMYVHVVSGETKSAIELVTETITAASKSGGLKSLTSSPPTGSLCCARFSVDKLWYRCEVLSVHDTVFSVLFLDYGNRDSVSLEDLAECPSQCISTPVVAVKCCLEDVHSAKKYCPEKAVAFLKEATAEVVVDAQAVGKLDGLPQLKLAGDLVEVMVEQCALRSELATSLSYPMVTDIEKVPFPKSLEPFEVMVVEIVSPGEIYVQVASQEVGTLLKQISEGMSSHFQSSPPEPLPSPPGVGCLCCAKFSADGGWYRSEVVQVDGSSCVVFFVDYGNKDKVPLSDMALCPPQLSSLPLVAVRCALNGVSPDSSSEPQIVEYLKQQTAEDLASARVCKVVDGVPQIELSVGKADLLKKMKDLGILRPSKASPSFPLVKDLERIAFPNSETFKVMVTEVASPGEMYVQVASQEVGTLLKQISEGVNSHFQSSPPEPLPSPPGVGCLCCAKFSADGGWYRSEVVQVEASSCVVFFVDYGNKDKVPLSDMAVCPPQLASLPLVAVRCALNGVSPDSSSEPQIVEYLKQQTAEDLATARVCNMVDGVPQIELSVGKADLLKKMKDLGKLSPSKASPSFPLVKDLERIAFPNSETFKVMVTEVASPGEMYAQVASQEVGTLLKQISEGVNSHFQSSPPEPLPSPPGVGCLCCAKFSADGGWYRSEVVQVDGSSCVVFFVDYGNKDKVPLSDMAVCPPQLASLPLVAVRCALNGVSPCSSSEPQIVEYLKQQTAEDLAIARVCNMVDGVPQIELSVGKADLLKKMKDLGKLSPSKVSPSFPLVKDLERIAFPNSETFKVMVTEVASPGEMYAQVASQEVGTLLKQISEGVNSHFQSSPPEPLPSPPGVGCLCCAKFSADGGWYRSEVVQVEASSCVVFFVDYGNKDKVPLSDMAVCPPQLASLPLVAVRCALNGVSPDSSSEPQIVEYLKQQTAEDLAIARVCNMVDGVPQIELSVGKADLLKKMKDLGILSPSKASPSFPLVKDLERIAFPNSETFKVMVTEVASPGEMYVQVASQEVGTLLNQISEGVNSHFQSSPPEPLPSPPGVGCLCCAKFSADGGWYRSEVVQVDGSSCVVFFVDYGNKDKVPLSDMALCPPQLASLPLVSVKCAPSGMKSLQPAEYDAVVSFLQKHAVDRIYLAKVANLGTIPELDLTDDGENLLDQVVKQGIVTQPPCQLPKVSSLKRFSVPDPPEVFHAMVTEVVNPQELYLQVAVQQVTALLSEITDGIDATFKTNPPAPLKSLPAVGSLCCARYSVDSLWYRVEILCVKDASDISVLFLDFGNVEHVVLSSLALCPPQYASLQIVAVRCSLGGLSPPLVVSVDQVTNFLKQNCDKLLSAKVLDRVDGVPLVELKNDVGVSLVTEMTKLGYVTQPYLFASVLKTLKFPETGNNCETMVFEVVNLAELYVHVRMDETATTMDKITDAINANFKTRPKPLTTPPVVGALHLAKFEEDCWSRAEIVAVKSNRCKAFFVDYGNTDVVSLSDVVACPDSLATFPKIAIKCALNNVPPEYMKSEKHISRLKEVTSNSVVSAKFVCERDGVPHVDLLKDDTNVLSQLGILSTNQAVPMVADLKKCTFPDSGSPFQILVCELVGPQELYVQVGDNKTVELLSTVTQGIASFFGSGSFDALPKHPAVGSLCCAKFSQDGVWYRVRVDAVLGNKCRVFFVDFGNSEEVELKDMAACPPAFCNIPILAVRCALYGMDDFKWSSKALDILKDLTLNHLLEASVVSDFKQDYPVVRLVDKSDGTLISAKFEEKYRSTITSKVPLRQCQVSEVNSPSSFYIQYVEQENISNFSTLKVLQEVYADASPYRNFEPSVGALCCAQYSVDKLWYRCKVLSLSKQAARLLYIDFGSVCNVLRSNVYQLDEQFTKFPPLAVHCTLDGVQPATASGWSEEASGKFQEMCDGVLLFTCGLVGDPRVVSLYKDSNSGGSVADALVSCGYGRPLNVA